jgi:RNA recognition motif-containing protein
MRQFGKETRMSTDIYIDNLPLDTTAVEIRALFYPYGVVKNVHLIKDQETGRLRGFGFVEMTSGANEAIAALNDSELGGCCLKVRYPAKWRQQRPPRARHW